jgi:hypothetical protein
MSANEYWESCIAEALDDAGITASKEQIEIIAGWVEGAHDNYSTAMGYDVIPNPVIYQAEKELARIKKAQADNDQWIRSTNPCKRCTTTGWVIDGWGRDMRCDYCDGKGRV